MAVLCSIAVSSPDITSRFCLGASRTQRVIPIHCTRLRVQIVPEDFSATFGWTLKKSEKPKHGHSLFKLRHISGTSPILSFEPHLHKKYTVPIVSGCLLVRIEGSLEVKLLDR